MVRYFISWAPIVVVVATLVLLTNAFLALIVLGAFLLIVLAAVAWGFVAGAELVVRTVGRRRREHAATRAARALST